MSSNPRRTPMTRPAAGPGNALTLKTNMFLRKGATFHSPTSPASDESITFRPPPLPRRSQTNLDDVVDAHRRRVALTLGDIDKSLASISGSSPSSPRRSFRDNSLPIPRSFLEAAMAQQDVPERRVLRPRSNRRPARYHESDSGLGTSIASSREKRAAAVAADGETLSIISSTQEDTSVKASAITRSAAATASAETLMGLSAKATSRVFEHILKPLLAKQSLKDFHPVVLECPKKIQRKEIVCLRDLEKTLLLIAPERTKVADLYLDFCLTSIRCIQATVDYLPDRDQTRPSDLPYTSGYFIDLVEQIHRYAQQLADAKHKKDADIMELDGADEIKLHGGITVNGRPAELVRVGKDGKAFSIATGEPVELDEDAKDSLRVKRSASEELADEEEIMRSMARRKKNAPPEEYAPKMCREPGCGKEFKRPCDLTKHEKTHSRPWKCPQSSCKYHEYGWPTEKERDRHLNDKHSSNPPMYECNFKPCPYKSKRESNCKQHMEKAHGWTYVRTKTNGKSRPSNATTASMPTPQLHNMPTPGSDQSVGVATPPQDQYGLGYANIDFPAYLPHAQYGHMDLPQELQLDSSPTDNGTPSTDSSLDHNSAYQDMSGDMTYYDDIYNANAHLPTPTHMPYNKEIVDQFVAFSHAELYKTQPAPHISPTGQGNAMLFTPNSQVDGEEAFDDFHGAGSAQGNDFILFPNNIMPKAAVYDNGLFDEVPSMAGGYSQPNTQTLLHHMDWHFAGAEFSQH